MDISALLPLLLGKTDMGDKTKLFAALANGGKPEDILSGALPPEASSLLGLLKDRRSNQPRPVMGLKDVLPFAPADIVGTLYKLLA